MITILLLAIIYLAFISLGLPDSLLGIAWPDMRLDFALPLDAVGIVTMLLTLCMTASSFLSGYFLKRFGTPKVTLVSCALTGLALLGFSFAPSFLTVILLAIPLGLGAGAVDTGLNTYVAHHFSAKHMNWLHCFWGLGASLGPVIMTQAIAAGQTWRMGYRIVSIIQLALGILFLFTLKLWNMQPVLVQDNELIPKTKALSPFKVPYAILNMLLFFFYIGSEVSVGLWANSFLISVKDVPKQTAGFYVAVFYVCITAGRFLSGIVASKLGNRKLVVLGLFTASAGVLLLLLPLHPLVALVGLALLGLGFAPVYPSLMHETPVRFGQKNAELIIGYQMGFGGIGGLVIPPLLGLISARTSLIVLPIALFVFVCVMLLINRWLNRVT